MYFGLGLAWFCCNNKIDIIVVEMQNIRRIYIYTLFFSSVKHGSDMQYVRATTVR